jgi:H+-translocating NAD(P) transhydrogenase subunit alpha
MKIGVLKETQAGERRVAVVPKTVKKLGKKGIGFAIEGGAGSSAGFSDDDYRSSGADVVDNSQVFNCNVVVKINKPTIDEAERLKPDCLFVALVEPYSEDVLLNQLKGKKVNVVGLEVVPRTSRAQSMDVLSSQANIAGYRAVLEATHFYPKFFPMMTSAGMAKPASVLILGAGVAGLQAIATARRLGAKVYAYDIRKEVQEQIESLGAKFINIDVGEEGSGAGGYAKELSSDGKRRQLELLNQELKNFDVVISTANIPGRKAPVLILEDAVKTMKPGSVIVDMAAANGGNCPLSKPDEIVDAYGVQIIGITNYPSLLPSDASAFFSQNVANLLSLFFKNKEGQMEIVYDLEDDIIDGCLVIYNGENRFQK